MWQLHSNLLKCKRSQSRMQQHRAATPALGRPRQEDCKLHSELLSPTHTCTHTQTPPPQTNWLSSILSCPACLSDRVFSFFQDLGYCFHSSPNGYSVSRTSCKMSVSYKPFCGSDISMSYFTDKEMKTLGSIISSLVANRKPLKMQPLHRGAGSSLSLHLQLVFFFLNLNFIMAQSLN